MKRELSKYLLSVFTTVWLLSVCTACQPDKSINVNRDGAPAIVRLHVESSNQTDATTRVDDSAIKDLHILIYNSAGELIGQKYAESNPVIINTRTATGCTIYAIANTGDSNFFSNYDVHSINHLKDLTCSITGWNELTNGAALPMSGCKENVDIVAGTNDLKEMTVSRLTAKVTFNVGIAPNSGITIKGYHIYGIPAKAYYMLRPLGTETADSDIQATRAEDAAKPSVPSDWTSSGYLSPTSPTSINTTFYMFENRAGVNTSITHQQDKIETNAPGYPADSAAYVVIHGKTTDKIYFWKIYLGATNTANFNIKRNSTYTYNITLNPTTIDTRVICKDYEAEWAGSNIYWDGTKLTFDEVATGNSDLKQGVHFQFGSLIGMPPTGTLTGSYYIPSYNASDPTSSTWTYNKIDHNIYCFANEDLNNSTGDFTNSFLNDAERNTDEFYQNYRGDICKYLSKTGVVSGDWRMPTAAEFGKMSEYTITKGTNVTDTDIYGTFIIETYASHGDTRFPASGSRGIDGKLYYVGSSGYLWSSSAYRGKDNSYHLFFTPTSIANNLRQHGFAVRCVR